ncbi:hypothetical protein [Glutamicibacter sp.]|uniref:hypothetical protein n=1 Tax=Glutamicibacter sp. TaxID=1931995 RepID=UPI002B45C3E0|nr:hypothetical protein [Glutamicibacter sp.]HJX79994.1 hypothetical protein [Glutamicibacter sp.]
MHTSLDGKIVGDYLPTSVGMAAQRVLQGCSWAPTATTPSTKGWLSGRRSSEDSFTHHRKPDPREDTAPIPRATTVAAPKAPMHYFSLDPSGTLGWERNSTDYKPHLGGDGFLGPDGLGGFPVLAKDQLKRRHGVPEVVADLGLDLSHLNAHTGHLPARHALRCLPPVHPPIPRPGRHS